VVGSLRVDGMVEPLAVSAEPVDALDRGMLYNVTANCWYCSGREK
jgi:hypothetical protein